jgi:hypothetical protein
VGETKTDDSQRDVWRLLAGPGVAAWKSAMSTVATAGQRGADWRDANWQDEIAWEHKPLMWLVAEEKMKGLWFGGWSRAGLC